MDAVFVFCDWAFGFLSTGFVWRGGVMMNYGRAFCSVLRGEYGRILQYFDFTV